VRQIELLDRPPEGPRPGLEAAVEFVNTTGLSRGRPFEEFDSARAAVDWLAEWNYLTPEAAANERIRLSGAPEQDAAALRRVRSLRAGLRELINAQAEGRAPTQRAVKAVNDALAARESAQLVPAGSRLRLAYRRDGPPLEQALAAVARSIAGELSEGRPERFRVCENDTCRWAFYDRSRPGTRRWCEMSSCGNRMKAARHRARLRASTPAS
jgi:predicted RNA-binding Zn ribbon-like protein